MHLRHSNIEAITEVADILLGERHPITELIRAISLDPELSQEAWRALETLPDEQRKVFAAMVAERVGPRPHQTIH
ncbi:MAG: hypothetical protein AAF607_02310 [Pseudomonadota bacterium]